MRSPGGAASAGDFHSFLKAYEEICIDETVQSGAPDAWGSWTELKAATVANIYGIHICCSGYSTVGAHQESQIQIGLGAGGSEVAKWQQGVMDIDNGDDIATQPGGFIPLYIPAGSRVAMRVMSRITANWNARYNVNGLTE